MAMAVRKKYAYAALFIILLLLFTTGISTVKGEAGDPEAPEGDLTLMAGFLREDGAPLDRGTVRLSAGEGAADYPLAGSGEVRIAGLPRRGDLLLTILDAQGRTAGRMPLSISEGAVIDAATGEDGAGHITHRRDTDIVAVSFLLSEDGSLQCSLWLARPEEHDGGGTIQAGEDGVCGS